MQQFILVDLVFQLLEVIQVIQEIHPAAQILALRHRICQYLHPQSMNLAHHQILDQSSHRTILQLHTLPFVLPTVQQNVNTRAMILVSEIRVEALLVFVNFLVDVKEQNVIIVDYPCIGGS